MVTFLKIFVILIFLTGCSTTHFQQPVCKHTALLCATVVGERYPVRFAVGTWDGINHVQAQAYVKGEWHFIGYLPRVNRVVVISQVNMQIIGYMSPQDYMRVLCNGLRAYN